MSELDKLGSFYLGREHDLKPARPCSAKPLQYDSRHLTTHAVCVGMTGSGKTGLCLSLLEEAAFDGVPAIAIDPKGDLGNCCSRFPLWSRATFGRGSTPSEAARQQMSPDEFAASQAELWRKGLAKWDEGPDRIQQLRRFGRARDLHARFKCRHSDHRLEVVPRAAAGTGGRRRRVSRADRRRPPRACWRCWGSTPTRSAAASTSFCRT